MPVKNYEKLAVHVESLLKTKLDAASAQTGINRTMLIRMMIKYCLQADMIPLVVAKGDPAPIEDVVSTTPRKKTK
jgi:antitoxin component of RelBE/YafQ-DinJ toxin-antitoxin module